MSLSRVVAVVVTAVSAIVFSVSAASASTPTTWEVEQSAPMSTVVFVVGGTALVIGAVIVLALVLNSVSRHYTPPVVSTEVETTNH